ERALEVVGDTDHVPPAGACVLAEPHPELAGELVALQGAVELPDRGHVPHQVAAAGRDGAPLAIGAAGQVGDQHVGVQVRVARRVVVDRAGGAVHRHGADQAGGVDPLGALAVAVVAGHRVSHPGLQGGHGLAHRLQVNLFHPLGHRLRGQALEDADPFGAVEGDVVAAHTDAHAVVAVLPGGVPLGKVVDVARVDPGGGGHSGQIQDRGAVVFPVAFEAALQAPEALHRPGV